MKISSTRTIEHKSSTFSDLPQYGYGHVAILVPGASSCSSIGSCCSCSCGMTSILQDA